MAIWNLWSDNAQPELIAPFAERRRAVGAVLATSALLNMLMLAGSLFMLIVYDEILPSRSTPSLIGLLLIVSIIYAFQAVLDQLRSRLSLNLGATFDRALSDRVFKSVIDTELKTSRGGQAIQPVRDLDQLRSFLSGPGPLALVDLPWVALYLALLFIFHWLLGLVALAGALILVALTIGADRMTDGEVMTAGAIASERATFVEACRRNAETLRALGMEQRTMTRWTSVNDASLAANASTSTTINGLKVASRTFRMFLQSLVLACGAYLVINDRASGGVIIASSILAARALAPIDASIAHWRGFVSARQAWQRLAILMTEMGQPRSRTQLPAPALRLDVADLSIPAPGGDPMIVHDVSFSLVAGDTLALIGPSGSGKSTLARALVGVWTPQSGSIRLDGAALDQWDGDAIGRHIGYLPQTIELFDGTIAQNIARFDPAAADAAILKAARDARLHELIVRMPLGYDTIVGPGGRNLSAGQRQRIALARALYGDPFLLVLDEPNSNLDHNGDLALNGAIRAARERGAIVILVAHRPSALAEIDQLLLIEAGRIREFGKKADMLPRLTAAPASAAPDSTTRLTA
jgi:PrtD family type I secretion system ABC transporter